jgi:hypothetical protein
VSGNFLPFAAVIRLSGLGSELIIFPNYCAKIGEQAKGHQQTEKRKYHDREELVFLLGWHY